MQLVAPAGGALPSLVEVPRPRPGGLPRGSVLLGADPGPAAPTSALLALCSASRLESATRFPLVEAVEAGDTPHRLRLVGLGRLA